MSITRTLAKKLTNYDDVNSVASRFRARRMEPLLNLIRTTFQQAGCVRIIDVGGTEQYWNIMPEGFLEAHQVQITLVNIPGTPLPADHGPFRFVTGDGCALTDFADRAFHIAHSNSVVEHVGDWPRMVLFAQEVGRVAEKWFVQTPNYWFPIEPHFMAPFFHWLPKPTRVWLVRKFNIGHFPQASTVDEAVRAVESARLLNRAMFEALFGAGEIREEKVLGLTKSFLSIKY